MKGERAREEIVVVIAGTAAIMRRSRSGLAASRECFSKEREAGIGPGWTVFVNLGRGGEVGIEDRAGGSAGDEGFDEGFRG